MHVIPPTTAFFKCKMEKQKNGLFPGFAETVEIQFTPTEWRYYYDCIRIHVESGENLLIPIHGYPVPGAVDIPTRLDFGKCGIATTESRRIPLTCNVPIDFDFEIAVTDPCAAIEISPASGTIPANGTTHIELSYTPQAFSTATASFEFTLFQFGAAPVTCDVLGSCVPGVARAKKIKELLAETAAPAAEPATADEPAAVTPSPRPPPRSGKKGKKKAGSVRPSAKKAAVVMVEGLSIPTNLTHQALVNNILNQPPATLLAGNATPLVALMAPAGGDGPALGRAAREKAFLDELASEKMTTRRHGGAAPTEAEAATVLAARAADRARYAATEDHGVATHSVAACLETSVDDALYRTVRRVDGAGAAAAQLPEGVSITFEPHPADGWQHRVRILRRFVNAVRLVIVRNRATKRLEARRTLAATVLPDGSILHANVAAADKGAGPFAQIGRDQILGFEFPHRAEVPLFGEDRVWTAVEVNVPSVPLPEAGFWRLEVPREYVLAGYSAVTPKPLFTIDHEEQQMADLPAFGFSKPKPKPPPSNAAGMPETAEAAEAAEARDNNLTHHG